MDEVVVRGASQPPLSVRRLPGGAALRRAAELAALTRTAYADSDPLPGLPVPDGARETTEAVLGDLRAGATVWVASDADGVLIGAARARDWRISRVCVRPAVTGKGVARELLDAVERDAAMAGVPEVLLNAVVERCLPPRYARLGYHVVSHWPSADKPLTEVTMARRPGTPRVARLFPWEGAALLPYRAVRIWLVRARNLVCVTTPAGDPVDAVRLAAERFADARLSGVDLCADTRASIRRFSSSRSGMLAYVVPRATAPGVFALWRLAPGHEVSATSILAEVSAR